MVNNVRGCLVEGSKEGEGESHGAASNRVAGEPRGAAVPGKHHKSRVRQLVSDLAWEGRNQCCMAREGTG